jgi:hypothetical protein
MIAGVLCARIGVAVEIVIILLAISCLSGVESLTFRNHKNHIA